MDRYTRHSLSVSSSSPFSHTTKVAFVVPTTCPPSIYIYEIHLISVHRSVLERKKEKDFLSLRSTIISTLLPRNPPSIPPLLDRSDQIFGSPIRLETTRRSTTGTNSYRDPIISTRLITVIREGREVWIETAEAVEGAL